jgi:MoxR-like ATPase
LLSHCLWTTKENREEIIKIVEESVKSSGFETGISLKSLDEEKEALEIEINKELYYSSDIYETVKLNGNREYFKCTKEYEDNRRYYNSDKKRVTFYIPYSKMKTKDEFFPVDENGNEIQWIKCQFDKQGVCDIKLNLEGKNNSYYISKNNYFESTSQPFKPPILFHKGDKKEDINDRLVASLKKAVLELKTQINNVIKDIEKKSNQFLKELDTPFVSEEKIKIAMQSVYQQLENLKLREKDCERLESLVS